MKTMQLTDAGKNNRLFYHAFSNIFKTFSTQNKRVGIGKEDKYTTVDKIIATVKKYF